MINRLQKFIKKHNLVTSGDKILVAVSGGVDSVTLLYLLKKTGYDVSAAHFNFRLRGDESDDDEKFVREYCNKLGVKLYLKKFDTKAYAQKERLSIQEAARELRYDFFYKIAGEEGFTKIAVAHHADDDLETFFINLFRGSGIKGLKGMPVKRGIVIRPLLFASRDEILDYANKEGLKWREDSSNASDKYLRNKIRHWLLPVMKEIQEQGKGVFDSLNHLKSDSLLFEYLLEKERGKFIKCNKGICHINLKDVEEAYPLEDMLYRLLENFGFNRNDTDDIVEVYRTGKTGSRFFSGDYEVLFDRGELLIKEKSGEKNNNEYFIGETDYFIDKPFKMSVKKINPDEIGNEDLKKSENGYFDIKKLSFPLKIRKWRKGDRFQPFGMKGSKLLSDFFTDLKLSGFQKENIWVMESNGDIIWVVGYRISDKYCVNNKTGQVLKLTLLK